LNIPVQQQWDIYILLSRDVSTLPKLRQIRKTW